MAKPTARVFATWRALYTLLNSQTWPVNPSTGEAPPVIIGYTANPLAECIFLVGVPPDKPSYSRATMGQQSSKDEVFVLRAVIFAETPGQTVPAKGLDDETPVIDRLEELADVIQNAVRDSATGRPTTYFNTALATNAVPDVIRVDPGFGGGTEGALGRCEIDIQFSIRI